MIHNIWSSLESDQKVWVTVWMIIGALVGIAFAINTAANMSVTIETPAIAQSN